MKKLQITKRLTALLWALALTLMPMSLMADNNTPLSVTVINTGGGIGDQYGEKAFDGKLETKWCGDITSVTLPFVEVQLAEPSKLDYYYLYTGDDINYYEDETSVQQMRNPKEWKLYAKVDEGDDWTLISHVTDAGLPTTVSTRSKNYRIDAACQDIAYNYFRFEILGIELGNIYEVGEICLINCAHEYAEGSAICNNCGTPCAHLHLGELIVPKEPTCTEAGNVAYHQCSDCHMYFDAEGNELAEGAWVLPALEHNYKDGICDVCDEYQKPEGEGTELNPYLIANWGNILWFDDCFEDAYLKLVDDVTLMESIKVFSEYTLNMDLNGHALIGSKEYAIFELNGGTLNLRDAESNAGKLTKSGLAVNVNIGTFNMYGGSITECLGNVGVAVNVYKGTFNMFGGAITENNASSPMFGDTKFRGVVHVDSKNGYFNMYGGSITNNIGETHGVGVYCVAEADGSDDKDADGCLAAGTVVTMADGSKKAIEDVAIGESVLTMNHDTGKMSAEPVFFIHKTEMSDAFTLHFSNGTDVTVVKYHSFFEKADNRYVTLNSQNASTYVGRSFYCAETSEWVELTGVTPVEGTVGTYALLVSHTQNHLANGMLSAILPTFPVYNAFEFGDNLTIDPVKKAADIALYGTMDYAEVKDAVTEEFFDAVNGQYATVLFGKGMANLEDCLRLAAAFLPQNKAKQSARRRADEVKQYHVTLNGKVIISGNQKTDDNTPSNLAVSEGMLSIGTLEAGSMVGIDMCISNVDEYSQPRTDRVDGILASDAEEGDVQYFTPDRSSATITYNEGKLEITHQVCYYEGESVFCSVCGSIKEHDHVYDEGVVTKEPSCSESGKKTFTCTRCGGIETDVIRPLTHTLNDNLKCTVCGHEIEDDCIIEYTATERLSFIYGGFGDEGEELVLEFDYTDKDNDPDYEEFENFGEELFGAPAIKHEYDEATGKGRIICNSPVTEFYGYTELRPERLTSITLPSSVQNIEEFAFFYNINLTSITLLAEFSDKLNYNLNFIGCNNLQEIIVPYNSCAEYLGACSSYGNYYWYKDENGDEHDGPTYDLLKSLLTLDDTKDFQTPEIVVKADATLQRSFAKDGWYSLCVPFSVSVEDTPFSQVAEFGGVEDDTYKFTTVDFIVPGKAYIVKVDAEVKNPTFRNVFIDTEAPATNGAFVGVYSPTELGAGCKVIGSGTSVNPATPGTMNGFRAYFPASAAAAKAMRFTVDGGEATVVQSPIEATDYKLQTTNSFNLAGQKVDENYRGIVIRGGKKYVR